MCRTRKRLGEREGGKALKSHGAKEEDEGEKKGRQWKKEQPWKESQIR